jgi:hypothetical protein
MGGRTHPLSLEMSDIWLYLGIMAACSVLGLIIGYVGLTAHLNQRFLIVADACQETDSLEPLIDELEQQS